MADTLNVRFRGFTDAWEQCKFGECYKINSGFAFKYQDYQVSGISLINGESIQHGYIDNSNMNYLPESFKEDYADLILNEGDIVVGLNRPITNGSLKIARITKEYDGSLLYQRAGKIAYKDNVDKNFSFVILSKEIFAYTLKEAVGSDQPFISTAKLNKWLMMIPNSFEEQKKVGEFFSNLDNLITLHQCKCEDTKELKKYMLQKMFPQNGKKIPEIRFADFTDAWEQRKFSDFTFPAGKRNKDNLDLEPYAITNNQGFIPQNEAHDEFGYMKDTDRRAYNIVSTNSFAYNPARINVGSIGYYEGSENVIVSSLYEIFQTAHYVDDRFLWHWFKSNEFLKWIERLQEGSVRLYFYYDKLCECQMLMPSVEEQKKIAGCLDNLDHLITLHQRKCDELKEVKKFMLQNMFPQKG